VSGTPWEAFTGTRKIPCGKIELPEIEEGEGLVRSVALVEENHVRGPEGAATVLRCAVPLAVAAGAGSGRLHGVGERQI
jgi:hypothetical protein